jgi:hypothetical protein
MGVGATGAVLAIGSGAGAGAAASVVCAPHDVQNFTPSSFRVPHFIQYIKNPLPLIIYFKFRKANSIVNSLLHSSI